MKKVYITGFSASGKSTVAKELNKKGILTFDIDAVPGLCHWRNKETFKQADYYSGIGKDWIETHEWVCDIEILKQLLSTTNDKIVVVGIASNQSSYLSLFDKILFLHCPEATLIHRLNTRTENDFGKDPSEQKLLLSWHKEFEEKYMKRGAIPINTERPMLEVVDEIISKI